MPSRAKIIACMERYLHALSVRDVETAGLSPLVKFTENCQLLQPGQGMWRSARDVAPPYLLLADQETGEGIAYFVARDVDVLVIIGARIRVEEDLIHELETIVVRPPAGIFKPEALLVPCARYRGSVNAGSRLNREQLIGYVNNYFDALETSRGSLVSTTNSCLRVENGVTTSNAEGMDLSTAPMSEASKSGWRALFHLNICQQIDAGMHSFIHRVIERRFPIVDTEKGAVVSRVVFDIPGGLDALPVNGIAQKQVSLFPDVKFATYMHQFETFHIESGMIDQIDALFDFFPYGMPSGWA